MIMEEYLSSCKGLLDHDDIKVSSVENNIINMMEQQKTAKKLKENNIYI